MNCYGVISPPADLVVEIRAWPSMRQGVDGWFLVSAGFLVWAIALAVT
jgi:hypothetical protein